MKTTESFKAVAEKCFRTASMGNFYKLVNNSNKNELILSTEDVWPRQDKEFPQWIGYGTTYSKSSNQKAIWLFFELHIKKGYNFAIIDNVFCIFRGKLDETKCTKAICFVNSRGFSVIKKECYILNNKLK